MSYFPSRVPTCGDRLCTDPTCYSIAAPPSPFSRPPFFRTFSAHPSSDAFFSSPPPRSYGVRSRFSRNGSFSGLDFYPYSGHAIPPTPTEAEPISGSYIPRRHSARRSSEVTDRDWDDLAYRLGNNRLGDGATPRRNRNRRASMVEPSGEFTESDYVGTSRQPCRGGSASPRRSTFEDYANGRRKQV